jgi:hypothetical protein
LELLKNNHFSNKQLITIILIFAIAIFFIACEQPGRKKQSRNTADEAENSLLYMNASQYGIKYPETFVNMQNRYGLRIEYCVDRSDLQLWISPQAWKSLDYRDRNFSNRDDHCNVFDDIKLSRQKFNDFIDCDYDPFYSVLNYEDQRVHLLNLFDKPVLILWFENKGGVIDFETGNEDIPISRWSKEFVVEHSERGKTFDHAAIISKGKGGFRHQLVLDEGRSIYARASLAPEQFIVITSELEKENIADLARKLAKQNLDEIIKENERKIEKALKSGRFKLKNKPEMQKLLDKNRRIALSMQDGGFMRSTNQYIYYLLWFRDGGMNTAHLCYSGWPQVAGEHARIALLNPNISREDPRGKFFGQLMAGPITKWEEDGLFFALWPAFSHWTQTGDKTYISGEYLNNLEAGMDWLERYTFDKKLGLFARYHHCETPMSYSRGFGWDNAVGRAVEKYHSIYKGDTIVCAYDIYMNMLNYSNYLMLSAMEQANNKMGKAEQYYQKAKSLERNMEIWFSEQDTLPSYGKLETVRGELVDAEPYGMDVTDYRWALSIPPLNPFYPEIYKQYREELWQDMDNDPKGMFICAYNAILTSMDPLIHDEDKLMKSLDYLVPQSVRPGKYLPMAYTIPELVDEEDGDPFHDVRPLVYSIAPWLSAVTNFGMHRMPFGIALRATSYLDKLEDYEYKEALLDVNYQGKGDIGLILLNGKKLSNTYQIPENRLKKGSNKVIVNMSSEPQPKNVLAKSTVILEEVKVKGNQIVYDIETYGHNILTFLNLSKSLTVIDSSGNEVNTSIKQMDELTNFKFEGRGRFKIVLKDIKD